MSSKTPNSLPGFLRRTIRSVHYEDHEYEEDEDDSDEQEGGGKEGKIKALDPVLLNPVSVPVGSPYRTSLIPTGGVQNTTTTSMSLEEKCSPKKEDGHQEREEELGKIVNLMEDSREVVHDMADLNLEDVEDAVDCKFRLVAKNDVKLPSDTVVSKMDVNDQKVAMAMNPLLDTTTTTSSSSTLLLDKIQKSSLSLEESISTPPRENITAVASTVKSVPTKNYKEEQFEKVITCSVVDIEHLRKLAWNGIPTQHRPLAWKILLGYLPTNSSRRSQTLKRKRAEYQDAILQHYDIEDHSRTMQEQETLRQVLVDVPRTAPDVPLFRNDSIRQSLARLLYIWAMRHPASSYVQGINDLATPLIAVFLGEYLHGDVLQGKELEELTPEILQNVEADVYWCLTNLLAGIQDHYTQDQPGVQRMVMKLEELVKRIDVNLTRHLEETGVQFIQFAFRWMNCLLLREFHLRSVIRLWDTYLSEGNGGFETFHVYVCAAFLCQFSAELQNMQFDELFAFMQNIPTGNWDDGNIEIVLSQAFVLSTLFQGSDAHLTSSNPKQL